MPDHETTQPRETFELIIIIFMLMMELSELMIRPPALADPIHLTVDRET